MMNKYTINNYKLWIQPIEGKSIFDIHPNTTEIHYLTIPDSTRIGLLKAFQVLNVNDPMLYQRIQIELLPEIINNKLDISTRLMDTPHILFPGIYEVFELVHPLYTMLPQEYYRHPYFVYIKPYESNTNIDANSRQFVIAVTNQEELQGILSMINYLAQHGRKADIIYIEDNQGRTMSVHI